MDPNATLADLLIALADGDRDTAEQACHDLRDWIAEGGFLPNPKVAIARITTPED